MKKLIIAAGFLALSPAAYADFLGIFVGAGVYQSSFKGDFVDESSSAKSDIDLKDDLKLSSNQNGYAYFALEHPLPLAPNVRISVTKLKFEGSNRLSNNIEFSGERFAAETRVKSTTDLSLQDATLYYEILDNWVEIDLGVTLRRYQGDIELQSDVEGERTTAARTLGLTIPMIHGKAQFNLPFSGLSAVAQGDVIEYRGHRLSDIALFIQYEATLGFGVEGGVRTFQAEIDDQNSITSDFGYTGFFLGATFHF